MPVLRIALFALAVLTLALTSAPRPVSVLYAGSLVVPMEGPIKAALAARSIAFAGEPGGSKALAHLIAAGLRTPDIFISVDPQLVRALGARIGSADTFASTQLGIGWTDDSPHAKLFAAVAAGKLSLLRALGTPGLHIGRTDPRLDPKGSYTLRAMRLFAGDAGARRILGTDRNATQIFPEETLLARLETGEIDVGFFYRTEAVAKGLNFLALPGKASLSHDITFTLAILRDAPHPRTARRFAAFLLHGAGRGILQHAGLRYLR